MIPCIHLAGWQKIAWALDEDLRWARAALEGSVVFTSLPRARIVLAAWWPAIEAIGAAALRGKTVVCFADNPPAFYLTRPGFAGVAGRVDLWIARSREAFHQFQALGMPVARSPYGVDPQVFRPLDASAIRQEWEIPGDAFVIGNFHRDSEGSDLSRPKVQKGPDVFLEIARELHRRVPRTMVLLAGPRRHWLLGKLETAGVPVRFAGQKPGTTDDYERNILDRPALNRLYQALDVCVVSSRWEGGPYSVLEAVLAGRPVISTPVGIARDLLPAACLYEAPAEAADLLERHSAAGSLIAPDRQQVLSQHSLEALQASLRGIFGQLPEGGVSAFSAFASRVNTLLARLNRPVWGKRVHPVAEVAAQMKAAGSVGCFYRADTPDVLALAASSRGIQNALAQ